MKKKIGGKFSNKNFREDNVRKNFWEDNVRKIFGEDNVRQFVRGGQCPENWSGRIMSENIQGGRCPEIKGGQCPEIKGGQCPEG